MQKIYNIKTVDSYLGKLYIAQWRYKYVPFLWFSCYHDLYDNPYYYTTKDAALAAINIFDKQNWSKV